MSREVVYIGRIRAIVEKMNFELEIHDKVKYLKIFLSYDSDLRYIVEVFKAVMVIKNFRTKAERKVVFVLIPKRSIVDTKDKKSGILKYDKESGLTCLDVSGGFDRLAIRHPMSIFNLKENEEIIGIEISYGQIEIIKKIRL